MSDGPWLVGFTRQFIEEFAVFDTEEQARAELDRVIAEEGGPLAAIESTVYLARVVEQRPVTIDY